MYKLKIFFTIVLLSYVENIFPNDVEHLTIHYQEREPYFINDKVTKKVGDGVLYHLTKKILEDANISFDFNELPTVRTFFLMKENKEKICISYTTYDSARIEFAQYSLPFFQGKPEVVIYRKNDLRFSKYKTIKEILKDNNLILLVKRGYTYGNYIDKILLEIKKYDRNKFEQDVLFNKINITYMDNITMLKQITLGRADYMIMGMTEYQYLKDNYKENFENIRYKYIADLPGGLKRFFLCSKNVDKKTMNKINQSILKVVGKL